MSLMSCTTLRAQDEAGHLELRLPDPSLGVTQEGDERGAQGVLLIVVLGAVAVRQLDEAVVIGQVGIGLAETPRPPETDEEKIQGKGTHLVQLNTSQTCIKVS